MIPILMTELRRTTRNLAASPGFTAVAVISLAIGIGANVAIFGAVRTLLLDSLPVPRAHELVHLGWTEPSTRVPISQVNSTGYRDPDSTAFLRSNFSYPQYMAIRAAGARLLPLTGYSFLREVSIAIDGRPPVVAAGMLADGDYFSTLGVSTVLGRPLIPEDDRASAADVAVISHRFWLAAFGGDRAIVGRRMRVNGGAVEIVGVMDPAFTGLSRSGPMPDAAVTLPLRLQPLVAAQWSPDRMPLFTAEAVNWLRLMGRLATPDAAASIEAALTPVFLDRAPEAARASSPPVRVRLLSGARGEPVSISGERPLLILMGVVATVLVLACINVAGLLLARGLARQRELAVRRAIGASRARLVWELLLESLVLAALGGTAGMVLAIWGRDAFAAMLTAGLGTSGFNIVRLEMPVDWRMLVAAAAIATGVAVLCGVLPATRLSNVDPSSMLKLRGAGAMPTSTIGRALIALQIAVSVPLLVGALLFLRTVGNLAGIELGFDPRGVAFFRLNPEYASAAAEDHERIYAATLQRIQAVPGVISATLMENALLTGVTSNDTATVDGREFSLLMNAVGPRFVETMGMRLTAGRTIDENDRAGRPNVAMINEAAVAQHFGGASPIGRVIRVGRRDLEIVGVVSDSRYTRPRSDVRPVLFDSALQRRGFGGHHLVLRTDRPMAAVEADVRRAVVAVNANLPVPEIRSQAAQVELANARERVFAQLLTLFGGFALLLAGIGLHGVTAYSVARRTNEIGVRVAVGATPWQIGWLVVRHVGALALIGLALGVPAALALGPLVQSLLFQVSAGDRFLVASAAALIALTAVAAAAMPALRATRLTVTDAIRAE